jgi:hypothetical protein
MVFGNRMLRKILGPEKEEKLIRSSSKFHSEELHNLCSSTSTARLIKLMTIILKWVSEEYNMRV